jgi:hypothetical protein
MNEEVISSTKMLYFSSTLSSDKNYNNRLILRSIHFLQKDVELT